jgi:hypothetical protein
LKPNPIQIIDFESDSRMAEIKKMLFSHCRLKSTCVPRSLMVLNESLFAGSDSRRNRLDAVTFESASCLTRIDRFCFAYCWLCCVELPRPVESVEGSAFVGAPIRAVIWQTPLFGQEGRFLVSRADCRLIRHFGESWRLWIGNRIKVFGGFCFARSTRETLSFELGSELAQIEGYSFANCSLKAVTFLASLAFVSGCSFESAKIEALKFECQLSTIEEQCLQRSDLNSIVVPRSVAVLGASGLAFARVDDFVFEADSELVQIEELCFSNCRLNTITTPHSVVVLCSSCFESATVTSIKFESEPRLSRIEGKCFARCITPSIIVPHSVEVLEPSNFEH